VREAVNLEHIQSDPYARFRMPSGKSKDPVFLDGPEIERILSYIPEVIKLQHVKDLFVFQLFTGLAYVDLMHFSKESVSEIDGYRVIRSNRAKTDESFISLFLPEAEKIADKYNYHLPVISNQKYNDYLKLLAAGAGINKKITTHTARHSYATYLLNKGIPIETVSRAMGHSNIKQTQHYAKILGKKVIEDMKKLL
jgi:site-specific recombinase XerD